MTPQEALLHEVLSAHGMSRWSTRETYSYDFYRRDSHVAGVARLARDLEAAGFVVMLDEHEIGDGLPAVIVQEDNVGCDWVYWRPDRDDK